VKSNCEDREHRYRKDELMLWNEIAIRSNTKIFAPVSAQPGMAKKPNMKI